MPGLIRGVARTAAIAGTATAVSNRVSRRQASRWSRQEVAAAPPEYVEPTPSPPPPAATSPAASSSADRISALKDLADLHAAGVLSDGEFENEKARVLAS